RLVARLTAAEDDSIRAGAEEARQRGDQKIDTFLIDEPRHEGEERRLRPGLEVRLAQERALRKRLARQLLRFVVRGDARIRRRIPFLDIDPVENAVQLE